MMPLHPDTFCDLQTMRYQELLAEAARARLADASVVEHPRPAWNDLGRALAGRMLALITSAESLARSTRRLARAWS